MIRESLQKFLTNIRTHSKKLTVPLIAASFLFCNTKSIAEEEKELPKRTIAPYVISQNDWANPRISFESNSSQWDAINEIIGKGGDYVGIKLGLDEYLPSRLGLLAVQGLLLLPQNYFSHEIAHAQYAFSKGKDVLELEVGVWKKEHTSYKSGDTQVETYYSGLYSIEDFGLGFVRVARNNDRSLFTNEKDLDKYLFTLTSGLNQQELNINFLTEKWAGENKIFFDQGLNFLLNRFFTIGYILHNNKLNINKAEDLYNANMIPDIAGYRAGLELKGVSISKNRLFVENIIPVASSLQTYLSMLSIVNYVVGEGRTTEMAWLSAGPVDIMPPLVSYYFTPDGGFYNTTWFFQPKTTWCSLVEAQLGIDSATFSKGMLDVVRFGGKVIEIHIPDYDTLSLSPFMYANLGKKPFAFDGFLAGTEINVPLYRGEEASCSLIGKLEYSKDDLLENIVKGEDKGFNFSLALKLRF